MAKLLVIGSAVVSKKIPVFGLIGIVVVVLASCQLIGNPQTDRAPTYPIKVLAVHPHDPEAFVQGLVFEDGSLLEGTGQYGNSTLRRVDLGTGRPLAMQRLDQRYFGEGITVFNDRIYQLTWKERVCFVYNRQTLQAVGYLTYAGEGWGLTNDGKHLYISDGTSTIRVVDPNNLNNVIRRLRVKDGRRAIKNLNELEWANGFLLANIWYEDRIAKIDPKTGTVVAWIDCSQVYPSRQRPREHVLNGIAVDEKTGTMFITGKKWPRIFEVQVLDGSETSGNGKADPTNPKPAESSSNTPSSNDADTNGKLKEKQSEQKESE